MIVVGLATPGSMGTAYGRALMAGGTAVVTSVDGRSERTRRLADGLGILPTLTEVVAVADVVVSVCPPAEARTVAVHVAHLSDQLGRAPLFVDLNAVAPSTVIEIQNAIAPAGLDLVDGAVGGVPPVGSSTARLFLSGPRAAEIAELTAPGFAPMVLGGEVGLASAVKMCTTSVHKAMAAVWAQALETALRYGVLDVVLADLASRFPESVVDAPFDIARAASTSGRVGPEARQIALTQASAGLSPELFAGVEAVYERLGRSPLAALPPEEITDLPDLKAVLDMLRVR